MSNYKVIPTRSLGDVNAVESPQQATPLTADSQALDVFTDFREQRPTMLESATPVAQAIELMKRTHEKLKLVVDADERFRGIISLADLLSVKVMQASQSTGLPRHELSVAEVMTPRQSLRAVDFQSLRQSRIGDLLVTMKNHGDRYVLVVDGEPGALRGLIASSDIARGIEMLVDIRERANSFSDIYKAIRA